MDESKSEKVQPNQKSFKQRLVLQSKKPKFWIEILALIGLAFYSSETRRTNSLTEHAITNAMEADRPWMGASVNIQNFGASKIPTYAIIFVNSGKRPARVTLTAAHSMPYNTFPTDPYFNFDNTPSTSLIVPGQSLVSTWNGLQSDFDSAKAAGQTFYVYGKIEYADVRTGSMYWTHVCWRYIPTMTFINGGFLNCAEYNEAK